MTHAHLSEHPAQEKPRQSGAIFSNAGRKLQLGAGSATPILGETNAEFARPVGVYPLKVIVLIASRELPLEFTRLLQDLRPFIEEIANE